VLGPDETARRDPGHPLPHLCALVLCFRCLCLQVSGFILYAVDSYPAEAEFDLMQSSNKSRGSPVLFLLVTTTFNSLDMLVFTNIIIL